MNEAIFRELYNEAQAVISKSQHDFLIACGENKVWDPQSKKVSPCVVLNRSFIINGELIITPRFYVVLYDGLTYKISAVNRIDEVGEKIKAVMLLRKAKYYCLDSKKIKKIHTGG